MRRRSERKKSVDPSPVTTSRRSSRRASRRTPDVEKADDLEAQQNETPTKNDSSPNRASSEERTESNKRGRSTRSARAPAKRNLRSISGADAKIDAITEEENGVTSNVEERVEEDSTAINDSVEQTDNVAEVEKSTIEAEEVSVEAEKSTEDITDKYMRQEDVEMREENVSENRTNYNEEQKITEVLITGNVHLEAESSDETKEEEEEAAAVQEESIPKDTVTEAEAEQVEKENIVEVAAEEKTPNGKHEQTEEIATEDVHVEKKEHAKKLRILSNHTTTPQEASRRGKRKWLSKKSAEHKEPILAISTDSLKNLISDVQPVPLSDVKLESSSEVEEVQSEHNAREISSSPSEHERRRSPIDKIVPEKVKPVLDAVTTKTAASVVPRTALPMQNSPSPPRNQTSNVLYITNLVRPFTVMQLKGLLARTGKIVENGFWIDRIKSKCYVQYENEDEAIETRHALHGVRWPVSNPKCLNVDFGKQADMERAIQLSNDDAPKYEKEVKENYVSGGNNWTREQAHEDERKDTKPIREWDLGKRDSREKREAEKQRSPKETAGKEDKFKKGRVRDRETRRSRTASPARKVKKEEPPLRLLDDLFRKTKTTPCIYWLPLTPEQIAEKEAYRQKRIEERKERIKQRELEREKEQERERERERDRSRDKSREKSREKSRDRSRDRRRSRSRDRRRRY